MNVTAIRRGSQQLSFTITKSKDLVFQKNVLGTSCKVTLDLEKLGRELSANGLSTAKTLKKVKELKSTRPLKIDTTKG
jgi:hypothetical protein